jgi:hypothetical protein
MCRLLTGDLRIIFVMAEDVRDEFRLVVDLIATKGTLVELPNAVTNSKVTIHVGNVLMAMHAFKGRRGSSRVQHAPENVISHVRRSSVCIGAEIAHFPLGAVMLSIVVK